jgi:hypothetical protein
MLASSASGPGVRSRRDCGLVTVVLSGDQLLGDSGRDGDPERGQGVGRRRELVIGLAAGLGVLDRAGVDGRVQTGAPRPGPS